MPKFSVLSWNVHRLRNENHAINVVSHIKRLNPDVFGLFEMVGPEAYQLIAREFQEYSFSMTYGPEAQEILVAVRRSLQVFFSQRTEFKTGNLFLRPGIFVTITIDNEPYNLLFLHPKSGKGPVDFGQRDQIFSKIFSLKKTLDTLVNGEAHFIVCGDLNTLGLDYVQNEISSQAEIEHLRKAANGKNMVLLEKNYPATWADLNGDYPEADLDHVLISKTTFASTGSTPTVRVEGWNLFPPGSEDKKAFIHGTSDHCALFFLIS